MLTENKSSEIGPKCTKLPSLKTGMVLKTNFMFPRYTTAGFAKKKAANLSDTIQTGVSYGKKKCKNRCKTVEL